MKTVQKYWVLSLFMVAGLIFAGCGDTGSSDNGDSGAKTEDTGGSGDKEEGSGEKAPDNASTSAGEFQLVSLNVPHMTWGGCAGPVREALAKVDGIKKESIKTDISSTTVSFEAKSDLDLDKALAEYKDNKNHKLGEWSKN